MDIETFRDYCLAKKGVTEGFPFDQETLVFKVMGKMFALTDVDTFPSINLKCDPEKAIELRERYPAVQPGYHMSKAHWNTVIMDGSVPDKLLFEWTDHSYNLIFASLPKKLQQELSEM
jgi:predicted DNA-binding protein (MmcQ/YjbR family)